MKYFTKYSVTASKAYGLFHKGVFGCNTMNVLNFILNDVLLTDSDEAIFKDDNIKTSKENIVEIYGWHYEEQKSEIVFDLNTYKEFIGVDLNIERFIQLFSKDGFSITKIYENDNSSLESKMNRYKILIAENRADIKVEQDIVAEYLRFEDYDQLPGINLSLIHI